MAMGIRMKSGRAFPAKVVFDASHEGNDWPGRRADVPAFPPKP